MHCNAVLGWRQNGHFYKSKHALQVPSMHHIWMLSSFAARSTPQSQLILAAFCNHITIKKGQSISQFHESRSAQSCAFQSWQSSKPCTTSIFILKIHTLAKHIAQFTYVLYLLHSHTCKKKKEKQEKKKKTKGIHWEEIRQTKAGIKKSDSNASLPNNNLHLHYVHVHTMCTKQFGTVWCTLWCVHVSISLCETAVFFYTEKKKNENLEQKMLSHHNLQFPRYWNKLETV